MIQPGIINLLRANRTAPPGMYLIDEDGTEVLLPNKYVPEDLLLDDEIKVFVLNGKFLKILRNIRRVSSGLLLFASVRQ